VSLQIACNDQLIQLVEKIFEMVSYQLHWIHNGRMGWEDFARLDQRQSYSIVQRMDMNWGDGVMQAGEVELAGK